MKNQKPGRFNDPRIALEMANQEMRENPPTNEEMIIKIAKNIAADHGVEFTPPDEKGATDRTSGEIYSMARNLFLSWRDNAAAHLLSRVDDESKFGEAARALRDIDAKTTMMLFDQYAGAVEFYFVSETPNLRGAVGKAVFTDIAEARKKLIELNNGAPDQRFFSPNCLQIYQFTGNGIIQPLKAKRRLVRTIPDEPPTIPGETMARLFNLVHAGQDSGNLAKIGDLAKALGLNQRTVRALCDDAGFNINVALQAGNGVADLAEADHSVEDLEYRPKDLQNPNS